MVNGVVRGGWGAVNDYALEVAILGHGALGQPLKVTERLTEQKTLRTIELNT